MNLFFEKHQHTRTYKCKTQILANFSMGYLWMIDSERIRYSTNIDIKIIYIFHIFERRLAEMRGGKNGVRNDRALLPGNSFNKSTTVNRPRIRAHVAQSLSVH